MNTRLYLAISLDSLPLFNFIISLAILLNLLGMFFIMIKNKKIFLAKNTFFLAPMICVMIAIFYVGMDYESRMQHIFGSIFYSFNAMTFRDNFPHLDLMFRSDNHFVLNYYINLFLIGFMSFSAIIDLFFKQVINFFKLVFKRRNSVVIVCEPFDDDCNLLIKSKERRIFILTEGNKDFEKLLMDNNIAYLEGLSLKSIKKCAVGNNKFISLLKKPDDVISLIHIFDEIKNDCYIECNESVESLIEPLIDKHFNIFLFNKYKLIGYDFLLNNSLIERLGPNYIDSNTSLLNSDKDINIFMIGFDNANKDIYQELIRNNQFAKLIDNKVKAYPVSYYIYANNLANTIELNHKLRDIDKNDSLYYAPFERTFTYDIKQIDYSLYENIKGNLKKSAKNIFIISQETAYMGLDYAYKLDKLLDGYDKLIYVRDPKNELKEHTDVIPFGNENKIITIDNIINESLFDLAKKRAALYDESQSPDEVWRRLPRDKRLSNINCIVSITHKLALMGLKITDNKKEFISKDEYFNIYDNGKEITYKNNKIDYPLYFSKKLNNRNILAFLEHDRWNAEMLFKGYLPMRVKDLHYDLKKDKLIKDDQRLKLHSCITSFDGLDKYYDTASRLIVDTKGISYDEAYRMVENKKYDYELMDNAYDLIKEIGDGIKRIEGGLDE